MKPVGADDEIEIAFRAAFEGDMNRSSGLRVFRLLDCATLSPKIVSILGRVFSKIIAARSLRAMLA